MEALSCSFEKHVWGKKIEREDLYDILTTVTIVSNFPRNINNDSNHDDRKVHHNHFIIMIVPPFRFLTVLPEKVSRKNKLIKVMIKS